MRDYYVTLQVDPRADREVIEAAYRRLARKWHPDRSPAPEAAAKMQDLNEAYEVLGDPERRRAYDLSRAHGASRGTRVAPRFGSSIPFTVLATAAVLLAIRFFGPLLRVPLILAVICGVIYWLVRSAGRNKAGRR